MRHFLGSFGWILRSFGDERGTWGLSATTGCLRLLLSGGVWMWAKNDRKEIAV